MAFIPNIGIAEKNGIVWGMHRFPDKAIWLCRQHRSGDWQQIRPANEKERDWAAEVERSNGKKK